MSADDLAAVREALDHRPLAYQDLRLKADAALARLAARLQEVERERREARGGFLTFNDFHAHLTRRAEAAEAREKALREALIRVHGRSRITPGALPSAQLYDIERDARAALAADDAP